jgi:hypothetical protein
MVPMTDFLTGVLSALVIYAVSRRFVGEMANEDPKARPATAIKEPQMAA